MIYHFTYQSDHSLGYVMVSTQRQFSDTDKAATEGLYRRKFLTTHNLIIQAPQAPQLRIESEAKNQMPEKKLFPDIPGFQLDTQVSDGS